MPQLERTTLQNTDCNYSEQSLEEFLSQVEKSVPREFHKDVRLCSVPEIFEEVRSEPYCHPHRKNEVIAAGSLSYTLVCDRFVTECIGNDEMTEYLKRVILSLSEQDIGTNIPLRDWAKMKGIEDPY